MVQTLMAFDKNGDGKLQRNEVPERMRGMFDRGDLNKDGVLTMDEIRKLAQVDEASRVQESAGDPQVRHRIALMIMRVIPVLAALDADHDGEISAAEIENAPAVLKTFDKNGDGRLTADEVTPNPLLAMVAERALAAGAAGTPDGNQGKPEGVQKK
jgi:Ca2+-binding EF-hand superfamily protein